MIVWMFGFLTFINQKLFFLRQPDWTSVKVEDKKKLMEDFKRMPSEVAHVLNKHMPSTKTSEAVQVAYIQALRIHTFV